MLKEEKNLNQSEITTDDDFKKISEEFEKEKEAEYEKKKGKIYYGNKNNFVNQYAFVATALRLLREDYLNGNLSDKEINQVEQLRDWGWQNIRLFGLKIAHKMMSSYKPTSEQFHDVEVDLYEVYWNKVAEYDSTKGTPTTFFVRYFRGAIREFILFTWHNVNSYDMQNYRKIKDAIEFYEQRRISYTPEMIATRTGMSVKIVTSTLKYIEQSHYVNIDDAGEQPGRIIGPEESYLNKEREELLIDLIDRILPYREKLVYFTRVNLDGDKNMPFEKVAEILDIPLKEVKILFNSAIIRLRKNQEFINSFGKREPKKKKNSNENYLPLSPKVENKLKEQGEYLFKNFSMK